MVMRGARCCYFTGSIFFSTNSLSPSPHPFLASRASELRNTIHARHYTVYYYIAANIPTTNDDSGTHCKQKVCQKGSRRTHIILSPITIIIYIVYMRARGPVCKRRTIFRRVLIYRVINHASSSRLSSFNNAFIQIRF